MGALLVGAYMHNQLVFCGVVGVGLNDAQRRWLTGALKPLHCNASPFTEVPSTSPLMRVGFIPSWLTTSSIASSAAPFGTRPGKALEADAVCGLVTLPQPA